MSDTVIGIKLADKRFYPVIKAQAPVRKRMVLTTVRDDQPIMQINLYRGEDGGSDQTEYIGSLIIEDIVRHKKGEPSVSLVIGVDEENTFFAEAIDEETGNRQSLSAPLDSLITEQNAGFESDSDFSIADDAEEETVSQYPPGDLFTRGYEGYEEKSEKKLSPLCVILLIIALLALAAAAFLLYKTYQNAKSASSVEETAPQAAPVEEESITVMDGNLPNPQTSYPGAEKLPEPVFEPISEEAPEIVPEKPEPVKAEAVRYKLIWGDTLWDIANTYYRNPWKYKFLAQYNGIRNPDYIIAGHYIVIPPQ